MSLTVLDHGLASRIVDMGRPRSRSLGVSVGGAADRRSLALGNSLIGNPPDAAALEITLKGPHLCANAEVGCVVFGAPFELSGSRDVGRSFNLDAGDILKIGGTATGCRAYLCVSGGFSGPEILASDSALEPIRRGDPLECRVSSLKPRWGMNPFDCAPGVPPDLGSPGVPPVGPVERVVTSDFQADRRDAGPTQIRVLPGPQRVWFPDSQFFEQTYTVAAASNRMGLRLLGVPLLRPPRELSSEPVAPGAVQITNDGLPVILGVDGQTIGGYPKIAHVIRADFDGLGQLRPGSSMRFVETSPAEAEAAFQSKRAALKRTLALWRTAIEFT